MCLAAASFFETSFKFWDDQIYANSVQDRTETVQGLGLEVAVVDDRWITKAGERSLSRDVVTPNVVRELKVVLRHKKYALKLNIYASFLTSLYETLHTSGYTSRQTNKRGLDFAYQILAMLVKG